MTILAATAETRGDDEVIGEADDNDGKGGKGKDRGNGEGDDDDKGDDNDNEKGKKEKEGDDEDEEEEEDEEMEDGAEESKEETAEGAWASPEEHTGERPGQGEGNVVGRGNPYTEKGWDSELPGDNGGDGGGGTGTPTGQADKCFTIIGCLDRKADEVPGRVFGGLLADL